MSPELLLTGECSDPGCEVAFVATSYPRLVKMFHDHLRAEHPEAWVRA